METYSTYTAKDEVDYIWTWNVLDFKQFKFLKVENPLKFRMELEEKE